MALCTEPVANMVQRQSIRYRKFGNDTHGLIFIIKYIWHRRFFFFFFFFFDENDLSEGLYIDTTRTDAKKHRTILFQTSAWPFVRSCFTRKTADAGPGRGWGWAAELIFPRQTASQ